jgi:hypothetical protein
MNSFYSHFKVLKPFFKGVKECLLGLHYIAKPRIDMFITPIPFSKFKVVSSPNDIAHSTSLFKYMA